MKTKILIIILALCSSFMVAQRKLADKFFENYGYIKASELYEKAYNQGDDSKHVLTRLGDCYYNNSNSKQAVKWYKEAFDKYGSLSPEYFYKYIQSLKSIGDYQGADLLIKQHLDNQNSNDRINDYSLNNISKYNELSTIDDKLIITIDNVPFNSKYSDFGAYMHNDKLYYASSTGSKGNKKYSWNDEPFLDILEIPITKKDNKITFGQPVKINSETINTDYHEASVAITNDGKTIYFTRDNVTKRNKLDYDKKGTSHLKIYKATLKDGMWSDVEELPFNDEVFSTGHPALSPDNKTLFFVSDRDEGFGQTDIYSVEIFDDGSYGTPKNLGPSINTEGKEMFPFVAKDSTLYFSSDRHLNLGLLDIFKSNILKGDNSEPQNLGAPYNSGYDDFAFFIDSESDVKTGFFSSNRPNGKGSDDIYAFTTYKCSQTIKGVTRNSKTNEILPGVTVKLIDNTGKIIEETTSNNQGEYSFEKVNCNQSYTVLASKTDYKDDSRSVITDNENAKEQNVDLNLTPLIEDNQIVINPIFFDFDKWNIRTDAQYELENIVDVMRAHPTMVIKIESHTDSRGSDRYNMKLSDRRAKSTRDYLLSRGIAPERIESAIGYGETQLLNRCSNGVKCSKEEHQLNRRSYFYIVKK